MDLRSAERSMGKDTYHSFPPLRHVHANWRLVRVEGNAVGVTLHREITILMRVEYRRVDGPKVSPDGFLLWNSRVQKCACIFFCAFSRSAARGDVPRRRVPHLRPGPARHRPHPLLRRRNLAPLQDPQVLRTPLLHRWVSWELPPQFPSLPDNLELSWVEGRMAIWTVADGRGLTSSFYEKTFSEYEVQRTVLWTWATSRRRPNIYVCVGSCSVQHSHTTVLVRT